MSHETEETVNKKELTETKMAKLLCASRTSHDQNFFESEIWLKEREKIKRDNVVRCTSTSGICAALVESAQSSASRQGNPTAGCQRKSSSSMVRNGFPKVE